jgi:ABC-2 type transport system ATP-binding protein
MININIPQFSYRDDLVLQNISVAFSSGQTHGIVGLNGAGKTTFFRLLSGFLKNEHVSIDNEGKPLMKREVAFIDTDLYLYPKLTAREFLSIFKAESFSYNEEKLAELFRLPLDALTEQFSTGMKKKLILLSQVKQDKSVFILDEPFNGLDLETNKILESIIRILNQRGKTVFISSHIIDPLLNICYEIHYLKDKTLFKTFKKEEFTQINEELFGTYTRKIEAELTEIL